MKDREIALFEAGIKLGALYHQFVGTPVSLESAEILEKAIERSISLQPFVESISVRLNREKIRERENLFGYAELTGDMIEVEVKVKVGEALVIASLRWDEEKKYPMMKVEELR